METYYTQSQLTELAASAIASDLAEANIFPLEGDRALEAIFQDLPKKERRNDGRVRDKWLNQYRHISQHGGLAFNGVDRYSGQLVGCISFKPNRPISPDRKYEQPPHSQSQAYYARVTYRVWQLICDRYQVEMPFPDRDPAAAAHEFWAWAINNPDIPIVITEGCKKALSALSHGFVTIAITGIWNGTIADRDENGKAIAYNLIPTLKGLGDGGRKIFIAFDRDEAAKTIKNVIHARSILAGKLIATGCQCYSIRWDAQHKGLDDFIVGCGEAELAEAIANAQELTGEVPDFKKNRPAANIIAEQIAKEWRGKVRFDLKTKLWQVYNAGVWETLESDEMEGLFYRRIAQDVPEFASDNYLRSVVKFCKVIFCLEK